MGEKPRCPYCKEPLVGCGCSHRKAADGKLVHKKCLEKYNYILEEQKKNEQKKREE
jgi:uncharacterized protein YbaR (Trm112 family)